MINDIYVFGGCSLLQKSKTVSGLTQTQIGFVVGCLDIANICFSFVVASTVNSKNIKFFYSTGMLWSSVTVAAFGILGDAPDGTVYFVSCLICRIFNGIGASMLYSTALPVAIQMYPEKAGIVTSIIQTSLGLGFCLGPPFGSLLLPFGGYKTPFITVAIIELIVFILGCVFVPSKGGKAKAKIRGSDYFRFLSRFSSISVIIPVATIFCVAGIRDTAYSLYFENTLHLSSEVVGYIFIANSVSYFITGPVVGLLVELGFGPYVAVISLIVAPVISFGFFLPNLIPTFEHIIWGALILFANGFTLATQMNPMYLILEKVAIKQGYTNQQQIKTIVASCYNLIASGGRTFGSFVIGGYLNDQIGFYNMCLTYTLMLTATGIWFILFMINNGFFRRMYYDKNFGQDLEDKGKIRLDTTTEGEKSDEGFHDTDDDDKMVTNSVAALFLSSMSRSEYIGK